jgi:hypothetical protein
VIPAIGERNRVGGGAVIGQASSRPLFGVARRVDHSLALEIVLGDGFACDLVTTSLGELTTDAVNFALERGTPVLPQNSVLPRG